MKLLTVFLATVWAASSLVTNASVITSLTGSGESISRDGDTLPNTDLEFTPNPLPFPLSTTLATSVGSSTTITQVELQGGDTFAELAIAVDHSIDNRNGDLTTPSDLAQTILDVSFVATQDTTYAVRGYYEVADIVASGFSMKVRIRLEDTTASPITLLDTTKEALNVETPTRIELSGANGDIHAGRTYRFFAIPLINSLSTFSGPNVASAGSAMGKISLLIGNKGFTIDIKPGDQANCFEQNGNGVTQVAILGNSDFDVTDINTETLLFDSYDLRVRSDIDPLCSLDYVNDDQTLDLVCRFRDHARNWRLGDGEGTVNGILNDGSGFQAMDSMCVVPKS